ncbi:hypothetical protein [Phycicoccus sp. 3266]|uniref:hypothetical protein n=1 Tax=Phycicoccus sp. 3266 TaxID=2817751 RepID=UPI002864BA70|nr:hypothetical protein [Phycicoccus sp. 3266]MDR6861942.1 hypothetical protein [Phycicoccus sp. 3266]
MSPTYAAQTGVSSEASRGEIERTLIRYGATSFAYAWEASRAMVGFTANGRQLRFVLPMPDRAAREFTHTPTRGNRRTEAEAAKAYEQGVKQRWRALALVIKAKLEAVEAGIVSFEQEFGMHMVLPDGRTAAEHVIPAIDQAYATGQMRPLLQIGAGS